MVQRCVRAVLAAFLLLAALAAPAWAAERRVALVIGNGAYAHAQPLPNPPRDAEAVAAVLRRVGFTVVEGIDLDRRGTGRLLSRFVQQAAGADAALVFYAGHGLEVSGKNYIVPVDAELEDAFALTAETVAVDEVLAALENTARTGLLFLDACRDNPFARRLRSGGPTRSLDVGSGLAPISAPAGLFVGFATSPGDVADDGRGEHSPFTEAFLAHLDRPGLEVRQLMTRVRRDVLSKTGNAQRPWDQSSLAEDFYFVPPTPAASPPARPAGPERAEVAFWEDIRGSDDPRLFVEYLRRFPEGLFALIARSKLEQLGFRRPAEGASSEPESAEAAGAADPASRLSGVGEPNQEDLVRRAQAALNELGRLAGPPDGKLGPRTLAVLRDMGVPLAAGRVDEGAVAALEAQAAARAEEARRVELARLEEERQARERLAAAERDTHVAEMQEGLRRLGRLFDPADGELTPATHQALLRYKREKGIGGEPTGAEVLAALRSEVAALDEAEGRRLAQDKEGPAVEAPALVRYSEKEHGARIAGRVTDGLSGVAEVTIDGEPVSLAPDGSFSRMAYLAPDERRELDLVARDRAGNETRLKVEASRVLAVGTAVGELPPLNPGRVRAAPNPDAVAVVIGVERYESLPAAKYAASDAKLFVDYAQYALGVPPDRVLYLVDERARTLDLLERVDEHLGRFAREGRSDVYVFFSGHGFAEDGAPLLLAHDFRKSAAARTSIGQKELLDRVGEFRPRSATLFVDACFSGYSRSNELLVADARLLSVEVDLAAGAGAAAVLASSGPDDISVAIETNKVRNGAFSYMLMRGLEGAADEDGDGAITVGELFGFVRAEVPRHAQTPGGRQVPWYNGADADRVLVRLR
jgi:uncharacterized caspase-like protein